MTKVKRDYLNNMAVKINGEQLALVLMDKPDIFIVSGEGEQGTIEEFTGKKTVRAIRTRLNKEIWQNRWARAIIATDTACYKFTLDTGK